MKYSPKFFKETMPEWKKKKDTFISRYIHRPISFYFSSIFVEIGMTANQVSFVALLIAIITDFLFVSTSTTIRVLAFLLLNLWAICDCADGNIARSLGGAYGDFIDATSSYFLFGFMFAPLSYSVFMTGGLILPPNEPLIILIGALTGSFDTMTRLFFQKMKNNAYEMSKGKSISEGVIFKENKIDWRYIQSKIDGEFCCGGTVNISLIVVSIIIKSWDVFIFIYFLYNILTFIVSSAYIIYKTGCLKK